MNHERDNFKNPVSLPFRITPWLFIGSLEEANAPVKLLSDLGIEQIINVTHNIDHVHKSETGNKIFKRFRVPIKDVSSTRIDVHFQRVALLIQECMHSTKGATLLHCFEGISRSVTLGIASMMIIDKITFKEAFDLMRTVRPISEPNHGFHHQLKQLDLRLHGQTVNFSTQEHITRWTTFASTQDEIVLQVDAEIGARLFEDACQAIQETLNDGKTLEVCIRSCMESYATSTERDALARDSFAKVLISIPYNQDNSQREDNGTSSQIVKRFESLSKSEDWQDFCLDAPLAEKFAHQMINLIKSRNSAKPILKD